MANLHLSPPLLKTKLHIPRRRPDMVARIQLTGRLNENLPRKLTLITAPAGYGKTNLATEWVHSIHAASNPAYRVTWLSLNETDSEPVYFIAYLVAALQQVAPEVGQGLPALYEMSQLPPLTDILGGIINDVAGLDFPILLVLDDYHVISAAEVHDALRYLVENQPHQLHLVITTREDPPLPLSRLRARGEMVEVRMQDLRFSRTEARQFFAQSMNLDLESGLSDELEARTEGWIAGLQLAGFVLKNQADRRRFVETFSGSQRYVLDYLADEVLQSQSPSLRRFLTQTAILQQFNAELCQEITGNPDSRSILEQLEQTNLFIVPLDQERIWYRYHHLFADFLLTELSKVEAAALRKQAALWHEDQGMVIEAVAYALESADVDFIADMVDRALRQETVWSSGNLVLYSSWLEKLPDKVFILRPQLSLNTAFVRYLSGKFEAATSLIDQAEKDLLAQPDSPEKQNLLALVALYRGAIAAVSGQVEQTLEQVQYAQTYLPRNNHLAHARAYFSLGLAHELAGRANDAAENFLQASNSAQQAQVLHLAIQARCSAAQVFITQGQLTMAEQACHTAIDLAGGQRFPPLGYALSILGGIALERNDLQVAEQLLREGIDLSRQGALTDHVIAGLAYFVHLMACQGNKAEFLAIVENVNSMIEGFGIDRIYSVVAAYFARMQMFFGEWSATGLWAKEYLAIRAEAPHEYAELTLTRYLLWRGDSDRVPAILQPLLEAAQAAGRARSTLEIMLLLACYCQAQGDNAAAVAWLKQAVALAAPEGFTRIFLDEAAILPLLPQVHDVAPNLVDRILDHAPTVGRDDGPDQSHLDEALTDQELTVLALLVEGLSNQQIADQLVITLGTAKWHVHNILQKLGVNSRTQATIRARELGLH